MRPRLIIPGLAACLLATSIVSASQASAATVPFSAATVPSFGHVFVIVGENKSLFQINSSDAPYIMGTLKPHGAWFTEYDNFLKKEIPLIEGSPAFGSTGVIFVTYDEGYRPTSDPNTMMVVIGPQVQAGIYSGYFDHYSTVATIEQGLGLPCLAHACTASTLPGFG